MGHPRVFQKGSHTADAGRELATERSFSKKCDTLVHCLTSETLKKKPIKTDILGNTRPVFSASDPHDTNHEGDSVLVLGLPPDGEDHGHEEQHEQHQESEAPRLQRGDGLDSVGGQNAQAQHETGCEETHAHGGKSAGRLCSVPPPPQSVAIRYQVLSCLLCQTLRFFTVRVGRSG